MPCYGANINVKMEKLVGQRGFRISLYIFLTNITSIIPWNSGGAIKKNQGCKARLHTEFEANAVCFILFFYLEAAIGNYK